jgi:hypothetical protein
MIQMAKCCWLKGKLTDPALDVWSIAKWRHRRKQMVIPVVEEAKALGGDNSTVAVAFCCQFFDLSTPKADATKCLDTLTFLQ